MTQCWVPNACAAIALHFPLPARPIASDADAWKERADGFYRVICDRVEKDANHRQLFRRELPRVFSFFPPIAEIFDGVQTPMDKAPRGLGAGCYEYLYYKTKSWSLNNLVGVDARGRVTTYVVGAPASVADSTIFQGLSQYQAMTGGGSVGRERGYPEGYIALGDSGFTLLLWMMVPFVGAWISSSVNKLLCRIFNFRLGQVRVIVENTFGRLKGRWNILRRLPFAPALSARVVEACLLLHNFVEDRQQDVPQAWLRVLTLQEVAGATSYEAETPASLAACDHGHAVRIDIVRRMHPSRPWIDTS